MVVAEDLEEAAVSTAEEADSEAAVSTVVAAADAAEIKSGAPEPALIAERNIISTGAQRSGETCGFRPRVRTAEGAPP